MRLKIQPYSVTIAKVGINNFLKYYVIYSPEMSQFRYTGPAIIWANISFLDKILPEGIHVYITCSVLDRVIHMNNSREI